jgi:tetratricopeptide (TPR) repeat protein
MDFTEHLRVLQAAQGDAAKLTLATVDIAYPALQDAERAALKESLEAAAIAHWCDDAILATLLDITVDESAARLGRLRPLSVVEPFPARGKTAVNVHEAARLALRRALAASPDEKFRTLSARAVMCFRDDDTAPGRIEWIYHLLCANPEVGATQLEKLDREWSNQARPEERAALANALKELDETELVAGRSRVWVLLAIAWARASRGEDAQLGDTAVEALALARSCGDSRAEGDSQWLLGRVLVAQGKLTEALNAYRENLAISERMAELDPSDAGWQRELAMAHGQVGDVLLMQGDLTRAEREYSNCSSILRRLVNSDPLHAVWQSDLSTTLASVGFVLEAQGRLTEAQAAHEAALAIRQRLAELDPGNAGWQSDLAVAHNRVGGVLEAQGRLTEAQAAHEAALAIRQRLAELDPGNAGWQSGLAVAYNRVGGVLEAQGRLTEAQVAYEAALAISQRLAELDPGNPDLQ